MSKQYSVVFDLDGTLIDTQADILRALEHVLQIENIQIGDFSPLNKLIGFGSRALISQSFEIAQRDLDGDRLDQLQNIFIDFYRDHIVDESIPYCGVVDVLEYLKHQGILLGICTNKFENLARLLIDRLEMSHFFSAITGSDSFEYRKPDGRHILSTLDMMGADPINALMIGDTKTDIHAAQDANIPVMAVSFGYSAEPVDQFSPDFIIDSYQEFLAMYNSLITLT